MRSSLRALPATLAAVLLLTACGGGDTGGEQADGSPDAPLRVGVSPVPHADILGFVADELAADAGLEIEVVEFTDYIQPNVALDEGELDANYFQTVPYLEEQMATAGYDFVALEPVHVEPLGLYSERHGALDELPDGATVAIANDPTNAARGLRLLEANGLITLADTGDAAPTVLDLEDNPRDLDITEIEAAQLPRTLQDVDAAVINGNYAIEAGLVPADDALALEAAEGNPNANLVVVREGDQDDPRIEQLEELLHSDEVRDFIDTTYEGAVLPAF
ncbi:MetQ/NlpA family ABC transporter substrate-binding protein [Egicoccus halophilus]|uniref:Lipoprotein n=1 Tax=Egicoccus halophilus TaxID=1670830 RepID=A0A8J3ET82_9ACTN|nr:MetQ/NlpA family ABC transporter substrate-binding protein [Egicoccus halophilus]GGI05084.1 lipoprotein [Egicoccus halophilus]